MADLAPFPRLSSQWRDALPGTFLDHRPDAAPDPALVVWNHDLAGELGLGGYGPDAARLFSGAELPPGAEPVALAYAGHQFGGFSPSLGDGRAHLLGEVTGRDGRLYDLQLKGSGRTPFSRGADGKAALGPMLREYLISEAIAALGLPTTRSLCVVTTGQSILREGGRRPGAVLTRVAASHIRIGSFQFFAARGEVVQLQALLAHAIRRHDPDLAPDDAFGFLDRVTARQAALVAGWMGLGFVHGVMNTDNMTVSGESIDYGPCAFMDRYNPSTVFSSIDRQGRYAYGNQPAVLGWNLARLAEALLPLMGDEEQAVGVLNERLGGVAGLYRQEWERVLAAKLGLTRPDAALGRDFMALLEGADFTNAFRRLARAVAGDDAAFLGLFADQEPVRDWLPRWRAALPPGAEARLMAANPAVIPRNHLVEAALAAAEAGDLAPFRALSEATRAPFVEREAFMLPAPEGFGSYVTFCGT